MYILSQDTSELSLYLLPKTEKENSCKSSKFGGPAGPLGKERSRFAL